MSHLDALPIIQTDDQHKLEFSRLASEIVASRNRAHALVTWAEQKYTEAIGPMPDLTEGSEGYLTNSSEMFGRGRRIDGGYHNPVARAAELAIARGGRRVERLRKLVEHVFVPGRFKHVYGPEGLPYLDSAQVLEVAPDVEKYVGLLPVWWTAG